MTSKERPLSWSTRWIFGFIVTVFGVAVAVNVFIDKSLSVEESLSRPSEEVMLSVVPPPIGNFTMTMYDPGSFYVWKFSLTNELDGSWWSVGIRPDGTVDYKGDLPEEFEKDLWDALAAVYPDWFRAHCLAALAGKL